MSTLAYIEFKQKPRPAGRRTDQWEILTRKDRERLGHIQWYGPWRKYVFFSLTKNQSILEEKCLRDIALFCEIQTDAKKMGVQVCTYCSFNSGRLINHKQDCEVHCNLMADGRCSC